MKDQTTQHIEGMRRAIAREIASQGRSTRSIAAAAQVGPPCLHRFLSGEHARIYVDSLLRVSYALGKSPAWLIREGGRIARSL